MSCESREEKVRSPESKVRQKIASDKYCATHREEIRIRDRIYRAVHREKIKARARAYYAAHLEKMRAKTRTYQAAHRGKHNDDNRIYRLLHYGLSQVAFDDLLNNQDGACAICRKADWNGRGPNIDHDHTTGKIRGLLCGHCNSALGLIKDDLNIAQAMVDYLKSKGGKNADQKSE